jgi:glycosyltransferase involved in cell wall biosynthesis
VLREYVRTHQIEVVINQWVIPFYATLVWKMAVRGTNCKVYSVHHNPPDTNMRIQALKARIESGNSYLKGVYALVREVSRLSLAFCVRNSHKFVLLSPSFIPIAQKFSRVKGSDKYLSIPNPISFSVSDEHFQKEKEIIYVGRIEYNQKRTDRVVDIWKELEPMYPDWKLTIIGDGDDRGDLQKRIHEYGLKRVSITGFVNPIKYYKRASILLLTSEYEGFGLVVAEAMSHGVVPVVYNSFESARDLVTDGYNGILVEKPYSTLTFTKVLQELIDKPNYLNELSNNSRIVSADYSIDKIAKEWYHVIDV